MSSDTPPPANSNNDLDPVQHRTACRSCATLVAVAALAELLEATATYASAGTTSSEGDIAAVPPLWPMLSHAAAPSLDDVSSAFPNTTAAADALLLVACRLGLPYTRDATVATRFAAHIAHVTKALPVVVAVAAASAARHGQGHSPTVDAAIAHVASAHFLQTLATSDGDGIAQTLVLQYAAAARPADVTAFAVASEPMQRHVHAAAGKNAAAACIVERIAAASAAARARFVEWGTVARLARPLQRQHPDGVAALCAFIAPDAAEHTIAVAMAAVHPYLVRYPQDRATIAVLISAVERVAADAADATAATAVGAVVEHCVGAVFSTRLAGRERDVLFGRALRAFAALLPRSRSSPRYMPDAAAVAAHLRPPSVGLPYYDAQALCDVLRELTRRSAVVAARSLLAPRDGVAHELLRVAAAATSPLPLATSALGLLAALVGHHAPPEQARPLLTTHRATTVAALGQLCRPGAIASSARDVSIVVRWLNAADASLGVAKGGVPLALDGSPESARRAPATACE